jgi:hypothetical protein
MKPALKIGLVVGGLAAGVIGLKVWHESRMVTVDITAFDPGAKIFLAAATPRQEGTPAWRAIEAGANKVRRGGYFFRLEQGSASREGVIAIDDESPVVLK